MNLQMKKKEYKQEIMMILWIYYVRNNDEYLQAVGVEEENNVGNLDIDLGNWFSLELIDNKGRYIEALAFYDLVYGSISECLENFKDLMQDEQFINDLKEEIREIEE